MSGLGSLINVTGMIGDIIKGVSEASNSANAWANTAINKENAATNQGNLEVNQGNLGVNRQNVQNNFMNALGNTMHSASANQAASQGGTFGSGAATSAFNAAEAQKNRDFQAYMSNTAHQREIADLKKAGLNPILSANAGAPMATGAMAAGQVDTSQSSISSGMSSAESTANAYELLKDMLTVNNGKITVDIENRSKPAKNNAIKNVEKVVKSIKKDRKHYGPKGGGAGSW